jgi:hypothetical protein
MASASPIVISLSRSISLTDEKALSRLMSQWLVYDVKVDRKLSGAEIKLFHSIGARPDLLKELNEFFPHEKITEM